MKSSLCIGAVVCTSFALAAATERDAAACGGCFVPPTENVDSSITAERMMLSISKDQTTLYDEIKFSGRPSSFAWVLPIKGEVKVGLSADILFATLDSLTAVQIVEPVANCPDECFGGTAEAGGGGEAGGSGGSGGAGGGGVSIITQGQVGPYLTVQLHSSDDSALTKWLKSNGYNIPSADAPTIAHYVSEGMDFLAMKLVPGVGVHAMQPVRVTTPGAFPVLPLRMVSVGTGATTGITLWVVADGRWEPQNFPVFTVGASDLTWNWNTSSSNYESLRLDVENAFAGRGWQTESSLEFAKYSIEQALLYGVAYGGATGSYPATFDGGASPVATEDAVDSDASSDDTVTEDTATEDSVDSGSSEAAVADLAVLFTGIDGPNARITRLRSDIDHAALTVDLIIGASADQSELSNLLTPSKQIGNPCGPSEDDGGACDGSDACDGGGVEDEDNEGDGVISRRGGCDCDAAMSSRPVELDVSLILLSVSLAVIATRSFRKRRVHGESLDD
jgi:hypothetical protein